MNQRLFSYLISTLGKRQDEVLLALFFGPEQTCVDVQVLAYGGASDVVVETQRLLDAVVQCGAISFFLAHNHPSGNVQPSKLDYRSTREAEIAARAIGVRLIDHLIVTGENIFSMRHGALVKAYAEGEPTLPWHEG